MGLNPVDHLPRLVQYVYRRIRRREDYGLVPRKVEIKVLSTRCHDGLHVVFWDFDLGVLEPIIAELSYIQSRYGLSNIYLLRTARGYHAVCFAKLLWGSMMRIVAETRYVDRLFLAAILRDMRGGLRYEGGLKPKHVGVVEGPHRDTRRHGSNAHKRFFEDNFSFRIEDDLIWDTSEEVQIWYASKYLHRFKKVNVIQIPTQGKPS